MFFFKYAAFESDDYHSYLRPIASGRLFCFYITFVIVGQVCRRFVKKNVTEKYQSAMLDIVTTMSGYGCSVGNNYVYRIYGPSIYLLVTAVSGIVHALIAGKSTTANPISNVVSSISCASNISEKIATSFVGHMIGGLVCHLIATNYWKLLIGEYCSHGSEQLMHCVADADSSGEPVSMTFALLFEFLGTLAVCWTSKSWGISIDICEVVFKVMIGAFLLNSDLKSGVIFLNPVMSNSQFIGCKVNLGQHVFTYWIVPVVAAAFYSFVSPDASNDTECKAATPRQCPQETSSADWVVRPTRKTTDKDRVEGETVAPTASQNQGREITARVQPVETKGEKQLSYVFDIPPTTCKNGLRLKHNVVLNKKPVWLKQNPRRKCISSNRVRDESLERTCLGDCFADNDAACRDVVGYRPKRKCTGYLPDCNLLEVADYSDMKSSRIEGKTRYSCIPHQQPDYYSSTKRSTHRSVGDGLMADAEARQSEYSGVYDDQGRPTAADMRRSYQDPPEVRATDQSIAEKKPFRQSSIMRKNSQRRPRQSPHRSTDMKQSHHPSTSARQSSHPSAEFKQSYPSADIGPVSLPSIDAKHSSHPSTDVKSSYPSGDVRQRYHPTDVRGTLPPGNVRQSYHPSTDARGFYPPADFRQVYHPSTEMRQISPLFDGRYSRLQSADDIQSRYTSVDPRQSQFPSADPRGNSNLPFTLAEQRAMASASQSQRSAASQDRTRQFQAKLSKLSMKKTLDTSDRDRYSSKLSDFKSKQTKVESDVENMVHFTSDELKEEDSIFYPLPSFKPSIEQSPQPHFSDSANRASQLRQRMATRERPRAPSFG